MAVFSFEDADKIDNGSSNNFNSVSYFSLKNDGDSAVVRFMIDTVKDMEILTVHRVNVNGKSRNVNCVREATDSTDMCPLCQSGSPAKPRFFVHMVEYVKDPSTGNVTPCARVWERPYSFAKKLKSNIDNFGPLSNVLYKIVRRGKAGDMSTEYDLIPNINYGPMASNYPEDVYGKHEELLENYKALGHVAMDVTVDDMVAYLNTGSFPQKQKSNGQNNSTNQNNFTQGNFQQNNSRPMYAPNTVGTGTETRQPMPWEQTSQSVARPVRNY